MSLQALLNAEMLRVSAGVSYDRGEAYFREGRVLKIRSDDDSVIGIVSGTREYDVRVMVRNHKVLTYCSCPLMQSQCKHVVALVLSYLQRNAAASTAPSASSEAESAGFQTREQVVQWAAQHEVTHFLAIDAEVLLPHLPVLVRGSLRYAVSGVALREFAAWETAKRYSAHGAAALVAAAGRALSDEVARVELAVAEEATRAAELIDGSPGMASLWRLLIASRRGLRAHASPRPRSWRAIQSWSFDPRSRAVIWKEVDALVLPGAASSPAIARLTTSGSQPRFECRCSPGESQCVHALALLDATLDVLADPARRELAQALSSELLRPNWSRALEALASHAAEVSKPRPSIEVWWRIERELGKLTLSPTLKKQTRKGAMSVGSRMSAARLLDEHREMLEPRDLAIAETLAGWDPGLRRANSYPVRAFLAALGHPRLTAEDFGGDDATTVSLVRVTLGFSALPDGEHIRLEPSIDGSRFEPRLLSALLESFAAGEPLAYFDALSARFLLIDVSAEARRLWWVLVQHGEVFPPESHPQLLERLADLETKVALAIPRELKGQQIESEARVVVRLRLLPDFALELELFVRPGPGAPLFTPGAGPRDVLLARDGQRAYVRRHLADEPERARAALATLPIDPGCAEEGPPGCFRIADLQAALRVVAALDPPPSALDAEWISERPSVGGTIGVQQLRVSIDHQRDWFGINGEVKLESGRLELAVLLDAARRQQRFVRVGERRWMELSETLRERLGAIADQTFVGKRRLELSPGAVPAVRALHEAGARLETAPAWQQLTDRLDAAMRLRPRPPATLTATLRDYQVEGHAWLARVAAWGGGACLADDMGLGKTVQAIALLLERSKLGPALVLAPTSVCWNWVDELARFAPGLRPILYTDQLDRADALAKLGKKDILIASYGLLVRDADALAATRFATLVIDEAQALKNPTTQRAHAARKLDAGFRIALSGTPLENHLGELWSLFSIVFPGLLGSWEQFRERYAVPIERGKDPEAGAALSRVIRPFLLRRTKQEVARELPARTEIQIAIALSHDEHALYEDARLAAVAELSQKGKGVRNEQQRFQVLAALTRLRMLASHPRLYDATSTVPSSKLRRVVELLEELRAGGHRALVFSQFTSHLALVREALDQAGFHTLYLDGSTAAGRRKTLVQAFQNGEGQAFLISLKAGGTGVNLTAADYVIHLDPWWNPAVEDQASDRAHRIGQTKPVTVYRLIARGTIEEKILAMHADKRALVAGILDGTDVAARLTTRDLLELLASGPDAPAQDDEERKDRGKRPARPQLTLVP
jgi:SNF2-related domain/Helicase conserved C-terminal domain